METPHIHTLPDEVLALIFSYLSPWEILECILPVCRRWQSVAQTEVLSRGLLFSNYDNYKYAVPTEEALRLMQAVPNLKALKLQDRPDTVLLLRAAGSRCKKLRWLHVGHCLNNHRILTAALLRVFCSCSQHLTDLTLFNVDTDDNEPFCQMLGTALRSLRRLTIINCKWFSPSGLDAVIDSRPQMEEFRTDCLCSDANMIRLAHRWGSSLQVLSLRASDLTDAGVAALAGCSQLRSLVLECWRSLGAGLQQLATLAQLEELKLLSFQSRQPENILDFVSQSRSTSRLRKIYLCWCTGVYDSVLAALAAACPCVEDVSLADCQQITAAGVRELLRGCCRLLRLNVSNTHNSMLQVLPQIPHLAPQLRRLNMMGLFPSFNIVSSVKAQMPRLEIIE